MISGIDLNDTVDYTLAQDKENPTIWKLGVIPNSIFMKLATNVREGQEVEIAYRILQLGLKGWENFKCKDKDIPFEIITEDVFGREMSIVPVSLLETIPLNVVTDLSNKIMEINNLQENEQKN